MFRSRRSPSDIIGGKNPTVPSSPETCMAFLVFIAQCTLDLELHVMRDTRDFLIWGGDVSLSENLQDSEVAAVHMEGAHVSVEIFFFSGGCDDEFHIMFQYCNSTVITAVFIFGRRGFHL